MNCNRCTHFATVNGCTESVGFCSAHELIAVAALDARGCGEFNAIAGASCAPKTDFFSALSEAEKNHQRRSSTADKSGLPDFSFQTDMAK